MIWISRGRGGWALWVPLMFLAVPALVDEHFHLLPSGRHAAGWAFGALGMAAGLVVAVLGFWINRGPGFWTVDSATGLRYFDKSARHSLYFIPMQYWGVFYIVLVIAIAVLSR